MNKRKYFSESKAAAAAAIHFGGCDIHKGVVFDNVATYMRKMVCPIGKKIVGSQSLQVSVNQSIVGVITSKTSAKLWLLRGSGILRKIYNFP